MINLPDFSKTWEYENNFYLSCDNSRISKFAAHYELFKMTMDLPGDLVECGVFKGASLVRFSTFQQMLKPKTSRKIIGFDSFGKFPDTEFEQDKALRQQFIQAAGESSIGKDQLESILERKSLRSSVELIEGNICHTVPEYLKKNPDLKISLLNLDTDVYEPAVVILEHLFPRIVPGGILMLDDYNNFPGETRAVHEYFQALDVKIERLPFGTGPVFIRK